MKSPTRSISNSEINLTSKYLKLQEDFQKILPDLQFFYENFSEKERQFIQENLQNAENIYFPIGIINSFHFPKNNNEQVYADFWDYKIELFSKKFSETF